jgi:hypothetical protein
MNAPTNAYTYGRIPTRVDKALADSEDSVLRTKGGMDMELGTCHIWRTDPERDMKDGIDFPQIGKCSGDW